MLIESIRYMLKPTKYERCWANIYQCNQDVLKLEKLIQQSDARVGWRGNREQTVETSIKSLATLDEPDADVFLEQLQVLMGKMRDLTSLQQMTKKQDLCEQLLKRLRVVEIGLRRKAEDSTSRIQELEICWTGEMLDTLNRKMRELSESHWTVTQLWIREMNDWIWELGRLHRSNTSLP
jgi:hypothetical protein